MKNLPKRSCSGLNWLKAGDLPTTTVVYTVKSQTFMMTGHSLKYILAVLNAKLTKWFLQQVAPTSGMGTLRWKKVYIETIPLVRTSPDQQRPFVDLVDRILAAKDADPTADTREAEAEIDRLVYALYGLTEEGDYCRGGAREVGLAKCWSR